MAVIAAATNLAPNPSFEYGTTGWAVTNCTVTQTAGSFSEPALSGTYVGRINITSVAAEPNVRMSTRAAVAASKTTNLRFIIRPRTNSVNQRFIVQMIWFNSGGGQISVTNDPAGDRTLTAAGTTVNMTATSPATAASVEVRIVFRIGGAAPLFAVSDQVDIDAFDIRQTTIDAYFDGDSEGCNWTGTAGLSASFRPEDAGILKPDSDAEGVHVSFTAFRADRDNRRYEEITDYLVSGDVHYDTTQEIPQSFTFRIRKSSLLHAFADAIAVFMQVNYADDRPSINRQIGLFMVDLPSAEHTKEHSLMDFEGLDVTSLAATTAVRKTYSIMSHAKNWCTNPSFEYGASGWGGTNCTISQFATGSAFYGGNVGRVNIDSIASESSVFINSRVPVSPKDTIVVSAQLRPEDTAENATVAFRIRFFDAGNTVLGSGNWTGDDVRLQSDWNNDFYKRIRVPTGAASCEIGWINRNSGGDDTFAVNDKYWIDGVDIRKNENFDYYIDGDLDGVKWDGATGQSTSTATDKLFTAEAKRVLLAAGFISRKIDIVPSARIMQTSRSWPPGTSRLQIVNDLMDAIGYYHLQPTMDGSVIAEPIKKLMDTEPYAMVFDYDILRSITETPNDERICNVAIVTRESPTRGPLSRVAVNNRIDSPVSTRALGREIVKSETNSDIDDGEAAEALAQKLIDEGASYETNLELVIAPDPTIKPNQTLDLRFKTMDGHSLSGRYWIRRWSYGLSPGDAPLKLTVGRLVKFTEDT